MAKGDADAEEDGDAFWAVACNQPMSNGRHAIQVTLAPDSLPPSTRNPQGFAFVSLALVRPSCNIANMPEVQMWHYDPLFGAAVRRDGTPAASPDGEDPPPVAGESRQHQVSWIDSPEWWRSSGSALAGDSVGLLLDCDRGELIAVKNGIELGVVFSGLEGSFSFAVGIGDGVHVSVSAASGVTEFPTTVLAAADSAGAKPAAGLIMERVVGSVLHKLSSPATLSSIVSGQSSPPIDVAPM